jgi:hypothetical protein
MARLLPRTMELRIAGEDRPFIELPLSADRDACCSIEVLQGLPAGGIRLRTRALTTTLFARYVLGDLFVHGIGGAKYDELGDELARGFFQIEPPRFLTLSLTQWLGIEPEPATIDRFRAVEHLLRDLNWNPDRHLSEPRPAEARTAVEAKWRAIEAEIVTRRQRIEQMKAIRKANEALAKWTEPARSRLLEEREQLLAGVKFNAVARSREYAFPLHSEARLHQQMSRIFDEAAAG